MIWVLRPRYREHGRRWWARFEVAHLVFGCTNGVNSCTEFEGGQASLRVSRDLDGEPTSLNTKRCSDHDAQQFTSFVSGQLSLIWSLKFQVILRVREFTKFLSARVLLFQAHMSDVVRRITAHLISQ